MYLISDHVMIMDMKWALTWKIGCLQFFGAVSKWSIPVLFSRKFLWFFSQKFTACCYQDLWWIKDFGVKLPGPLFFFNWENSLHANCLCHKIAKKICCEFFLFCSRNYHRIFLTTPNAYWFGVRKLDFQYSLSVEICRGLKNEICCTHARTN